MHATLQRAYFPSLLILIGLLLSRSRPLAAHERDFAGRCALKDIGERGDTVLVTSTARVFNYSDDAGSDATVVLDSWLIPDQTYWSSPGVSIVNRGSVRLRCLITIARREYNQWQRGARPNLLVNTANINGASLGRIVELMQNLVEREK